ncbi:hypothetical protein C0993_012707 [Termitomyces sp. T159_Od127]|nr:hypothetical protein C0993_012707 [Termitomyces sp. T159_Od127]
MSSTSALFTPLTIGSATMRNRVAMSALTRNRATDTIPNDIMAEYYGQRAAGGAGHITTEGVLISRQGTEWPFAPGLWNKEHVSGWKKIVDTVHAEGATIYAQVSAVIAIGLLISMHEQLWHGMLTHDLAHHRKLIIHPVGRVAHPEAPEQKLAGTVSREIDLPAEPLLIILSPQPVYGPSAIAARGGKFRHIPGTPGYVTPTALEDPWTVVADYKQAALNAKEAGFDGVERKSRVSAQLDARYYC